LTAYTAGITSTTQAIQIIHKDMTLPYVDMARKKLAYK